MTVNTNTSDRKALAKAIAEELGTTAKYMGVPSCNYQIGDFILDKQGILHGDDFEALMPFLQRNGMQPEDETPAEEMNVPAETEEAETVDHMAISVPAGDRTVAQLKNLVFMLYSRQALINRMEERHAIHTVEAAAELGLGSREYQIVEI